MTSQWVAKRKLFYGIVWLAVLAILVGVPSFLFFYKTPTCEDGKKNQNEKGIDCGGVCTRLCPSDIINPIVLWQRSFAVTPGTYNAVAYIQNPNVLMRMDKVSYVFRLYDDKNVLIGERTGNTFVPANKIFAVFEPGIRTGGRAPARTSFAFTGDLAWLQNPETYTPPPLLIENIVLTNEATTPRLDAMIRNKSLQSVPNIEAVAIIYDAEDNAIASSRTILQNLASEQQSPVTFTWPSAFSSAAVRKEILLRVYPSGTSL